MAGIFYVSVDPGFGNDDEWAIAIYEGDPPTWMNDAPPPISPTWDWDEDPEPDYEREYRERKAEADAEWRAFIGEPEVNPRKKAISNVTDFGL